MVIQTKIDKQSIWLDITSCSTFEKKNGLWKII